jgi:ribonuclease VapC
LVVDTSIILAIYFDEPHGSWASEQLQQHADTLCMSTVNLTEALIRIRDRQPGLAVDFQERLLNSGIRFIAPDEKQAMIAAEARLAFPLNLGDCFAYALAKSEDCPILTLDADFRSTDCIVVHPDVSPS